MSRGYCDSARFLTATGLTSLPDSFVGINDSVSRAIDDVTGRQFYTEKKTIGAGTVAPGNRVDLKDFTFDWCVSLVQSLTTLPGQVAIDYVADTDYKFIRWDNQRYLVFASHLRTSFLNVTGTVGIFDNYSEPIWTALADREFTYAEGSSTLYATADTVAVGEHLWASEAQDVFEVTAIGATVEGVGVEIVATSLLGRTAAWTLTMGKSIFKVTPPSLVRQVALQEAVRMFQRERAQYNTMIAAPEQPTSMPGGFLMKDSLLQLQRYRQQPF